VARGRGISKAEEAEVGFFPAHPVPDCDYLLSRAEAELSMAEAATNARAAEIHHALASAYLGRIFDEDGERQPDVWKWLRAEREKRQALRSIFESKIASSESLTEADRDLSKLLDRLGDVLERLD
jgi:hypothetical protein